MAQMKLVYTTRARLDELPLENGQIIYAPDDNLICLDMRDKRFIYHTLRSFETDAERLRFIGVNKCFYFVEETNIMWQYINNEWKQITPANLEPIYYAEVPERFPARGTENTLFYTDNGIYNWKESLQDYNLIANANTWGNI